MNSKWDGYTSTNTQDAPLLTFATFEEAMRPLVEMKKRQEVNAQKVIKLYFDIDADGPTALNFMESMQHRTMHVSLAKQDLKPTVNGGADE